MTDHWKGEHFIRGVVPTQSERHSETGRLANGLKARAAKGQSVQGFGTGPMHRTIKAAMAEQRARNHKSHNGANA
jgi:hypothetical protein